MSSVMREMRLASTAIYRSFEQYLAIPGVAAGQAKYSAFICAMRGSLPPIERQRRSFDWPAQQRRARAAFESLDRGLHKTDMA